MPTVPKTSERKETVRLMLEVLESIARGIEIFSVLCFTRRGKIRALPLGLEQARAYLAAHDRRILLALLRNLRRRKAIARKRRNGAIEYALTERGAELLLDVRIRAAEYGRVKTVVTYDIPEDARSGRDAFRRMLKRNGFHRVHYSVWEIGKDVAEPLNAWTKKHRLSKWVKAMSIQV